MTERQWETLPAQRGGGMAGIALQGSGYRGDQPQADDPGLARKSVHRPTGRVRVHAAATQRHALNPSVENASGSPAFDSLRRNNSAVK